MSVIKDNIHLIVPMLLKTMVHRDLDHTVIFDTKSRMVASPACLALLANYLPTETSTLVQPFLSQYLGHTEQDLLQFHAAMIAASSIIQAVPENDPCVKLCLESLPHVFSATQNVHVLIRQGSYFLLANMIRSHTPSVTPHIGSFVQRACAGTSDLDPSVFYMVSMLQEVLASLEDLQSGELWELLSQHYPATAEKLLEKAWTSPQMIAKFVQSFAALTSRLGNKHPSVLQQLLSTLLQRISTNHEDPTIGHALSALGTVVTALGKQYIAPQLDILVSLLLKLTQHHSDAVRFDALGNLSSLVKGMLLCTSSNYLHASCVLKQSLSNWFCVSTRETSGSVRTNGHQKPLF